ncbi:MAG: hypothetical protein QXT68_09215 [Halobacteria archaeon]
MAPNMELRQPPRAGLSSEEDGPPLFDSIVAFTGGFLAGYAIGNHTFGGKGDRQDGCCAGSSAFVVVALLILAVLL